MGTVVSTIVVDSLNPLQLARWWSDVLDRPLDESDDPEISLLPLDGVGPEILFVPVPEAKAVKNRLHLDVRPQNGSDQETELRRLLELGARRIDVGQGPDVSWIVLADPEGNEFCLLRLTPAQIDSGDADVA
jgi:Glyoxalase-like domain